ncbi:hypothetical protein [Kocuria rosea]|uniref:Uncharacterized protein n=1 Tax=Kocuria rosea TaxID=1275 RepID=A0A4R5YE72_KOCRO|nr:hypothetical protein [Kocuria rosea]TDL42497.1 hypothetical protein E2R59_11175 [Kocuria rosea]
MRTRSEGWVQLGLRGIFRKNTEDSTPRHETGRPEQPAGPTAGPDTGAREAGQDGGDRGTGSRGPDGHGHEEHGPGEARPLPDRGPLPFLVDRLTSRGADRAVLTLVQRGNTMTHQTQQSVGDADPSVESGTVDQDSPLFDPVADLYSEAMSSPRGAWQNARIEVGPEQDGFRPVVTTYGFADGSEDVRTWRSGRPTPGAAAGTRSAAETNSAEDRPAGERPTGDRSDDERHAAGTGAASEPTGPAAEHSAGGVPAVAAAAAAGGAAAGGTGSSAAGAARGPVPEPTDGPVSAQSADPAAEPTTEPSTGAEPVPGTAPATEAPAAGREQDEHRTADREATAHDVPDHGAAQHEVPDHVDHEEWHEDVEPAAPTGAAAATAAAAAAGTAAGDDHDSSAPETAVSTDVSPSYRAPAGVQDRPSQDKLAEGNLVLKEVDVLRRLADAQRRLFGEDGTAMDVSTVLVRVRALGTYYDALTHVRKNGFWDQRRTFDLVPEELLHVQELKDESYVEGNGAPLAMMFRFRPGIPPEVSFDYADEEAFVRYEDRLPAQNYLEELRMYPRTGAHIPQHMNEALQDWNY